MAKAKAQSTISKMYPQYKALWHLQAMRVLDENQKPVDWSVTCPEKPTRVAIIDTSVAADHPNLKGVVNKDLSLDFFSARLGSFPFIEQDTIGALDLRWKTEVAEGLPLTEKLLSELVDRLSEGSKAHSRGIQPCASPAFSAHGTNIAGLVGARPCITEQILSTGEKVPLPLPYSGVDPMCEIVQISNNFDPEPEGLILSFLYADLIDADVVLLPRIIADPQRLVPELGDIKLGDQSLTDLIRQVEVPTRQTELWSELSALIENVSRLRPVVCAAGNANEENAIYPANLASDHNGVISVGAVNAKGYCSSFSVSRNITVMAPSNDAEVFDEAEVRLDERNPHYDATGVPDSNSNFKYSSFDVISTDVPGPAGYSDSAFVRDVLDQAMLEYGSYFSRFGGTSASSALVAGFLSLGRSTGAYGPSSGVAAKTWLMGRCYLQTDEDEQFLVPCWAGEPQFPDKNEEPNAN